MKEGIVEPEWESIFSQQLAKRTFPQQRTERKSIASQRLANTLFRDKE
jgi:hypothetical protein